MVISPKTRYVAGYILGYTICLPIAIAVVLPKMIVQRFKMTHAAALVSYDAQHTQHPEPEPCRGIVAEMADGSMRYVEDPFPLDIR